MVWEGKTVIKGREWESEGKERGIKEMERERGGRVGEEVCSRNFQLF